MGTFILNLALFCFLRRDNLRAMNRAFALHFSLLLFVLIAISVIAGIVGFFCKSIAPILVGIAGGLVMAVIEGLLFTWLYHKKSQKAAWISALILNIVWVIGLVGVAYFAIKHGL